MIYSVWDPARKLYDYYQTPVGDVETAVPIPKHITSRFKTDVGYGNDVAWPLPPNAVQSGSGVFAKGSIAMPASAIAVGGIDALGGVSYVGLVVGVVVAWWLLKE